MFNHCESYYIGQTGSTFQEIYKNHINPTNKNHSSKLQKYLGIPKKLHLLK